MCGCFIWQHRETNLEAENTIFTFLGGMRNNIMTGFTKYDLQNGATTELSKLQFLVHIDSSVKKGWR